MSMINATERATNPPTTAQAAGRAKSECLERKIIQWEKMKHAAMNASKAAGNPIALPSVFGTYLSMLPVKSAMHRQYVRHVWIQCKPRTDCP